MCIRDSPILGVDNKSALQIIDHGGTWRTRYFAVRANRLGQEHARGAISVRYCQTKLMLADGLTKFGTNVLLEDMRKGMAGIIPDAPPEEAILAKREDDQSWWASLVIRPYVVQAQAPVVSSVRVFSARLCPISPSQTEIQPSSSSADSRGENSAPRAETAPADSCLLYTSDAADE